MAFGFPAHHTGRYCLPDSRRDAHGLVAEALAALRWEVTANSRGEVRARTRANIWSWGERITIRFDADELTVTSKSSLPTQCFDWGKNRSNVTAFFQRLERLTDSPDSDSW